MISARLKTIFALSIPLFIVHGTEEFITRFYDTDSWDQFLFGPLAAMSTHQAMFVTFQVMVWLLLIVSFFLILDERWRLRMLAILGLVYVFELHHSIKAVLAWSYYPGLITSLGFPILAVLFWREWVRVYYKK